MNKIPIVKPVFYNDTKVRLNKNTINEFKLNK